VSIQSTQTTDDLLAEIAAGAAERERDRVPPHEQIRQLGRAGLGALRVPAAAGGRGGSLRELFAFVVRLAAADSNIAQSLRAHYHFVEGRLAAVDPRERQRWLPEVVRGAIFGNATVERATRDIFGFETTLTPDGDGWVLSGTKYYSTGSLYADFVSVAARTPDGSVASAIVPADRAGVTLEDDWDGIGQRLTASGTSRFDDVAVAADEVLASPIGKDAPAPRSAFLQLYLVAVMAGIADNVAADAAVVARDRRRTFSHAAAELPREDPQIQQAIGQLAVDAFAVETVVLAAADGLDAAAASAATTADGRPDPDALHEASLRTAKAQVLAAELVPRAAERLFDAGGASATARELDLDRHWRNARTIASHNPAMYKARAIGDLLVNERRLPANGFF
jgi:alkylation response protein AidB-like acyl-CoA dehydrogenase